MNNYKKYLKYKYKYLYFKYKYYALKKQIGGNGIITYGDTTIKIDTNSKNDYYNKIHDNKSKSDEEFIKDLIIYYILNTHTNSHNYMCPDIKIEIDKINPEILIIKQKDKSLNQHHIAYKYSYIYIESQHKLAKNIVTNLAEVPCGNPIGEQSLMKRAKEIYQNIIGTIQKLQTTETSIWAAITTSDIIKKIQARYNTIAQERQNSKSTKYHVLLSDIFFWYVMINKMFIDKINFFKEFEPKFIETLYSGSWEASSTKQQTLAVIQQDKDLSKSLPQAPRAPQSTESYDHPYSVNPD